MKQEDTISPARKMISSASSSSEKIHETAMEPAKDGPSVKAMDFWKQQDLRRSKHQQRTGASPRLYNDDPLTTSTANTALHMNDDNTFKMKSDSSNEVSNGENNHNVQNGQLGEMQIKLDIAAAKLLTEEMKYTDILSQLQDLQRSSQEELHSYQQEIRELKQQVKSSEQEKDEKLQELYSEIQRLHSSHQAERQLHFSEAEQLRTQVTELEQKLQHMNVESMQTQDCQEEKWIQMQHENEQLRNDLKTIVEESERLELELETVTEDRDELLRRTTKTISGADTSSSSGLMKTNELNETETMAQLHEELDQLRFMLEEEKQLNLEKDERLKELQSVTGHKNSENNVFDLDISAIDVVNTSFDAATAEKKLEHNHEAQIKNMQEECLQYQHELEKMKKATDSLIQERDSLKECLADAMQELEENELRSSLNNNHVTVKNEEVLRDLSPKQQSTDKNTSEVFIQELLQMIKEKDGEIEMLKKTSLDKMNQSPNVSNESFHEDIDHVMEWIHNSSNVLNGSPSVEVVRKTLESNSDAVTLLEEDEKLLHSLHRYLRDLHVNAGTNEANLARMKRQQHSQRDIMTDQWDTQSSTYDTSTEASFERGYEDIDEIQIKKHAQKEAEHVCMRFRKRIQALLISVHKCEKENEVLRLNLAEAIELVAPLKEHVLRIDGEKVDLEYKLAEKTQHLVLLEQNCGVLDSKSLLNETGIPAQESLSNLLEKDKQIIDLKIEVQQLRKELDQAESDLVNVQGGQETFSDMPTPTKHNISTRKNRMILLTSQDANEKKEMQSAAVDSKISRLQLEVKNRSIAEETLKSILHHASLKISALTVQIEELLHQNKEAEKEINDQKLHLATLEGALAKDALTSSVSLKASSDQVLEYKELLKEMTDRNDKLVIDVGSLKIDLKTISKEKKKLKKSLEEAVGMLNSLRSHVETAERERKKLKKQLRTLLSKRQEQGMMSNLTSEPNPTSFHEPDPDEMANRSTILQLRSVVVEMEHEIRTLEERIQELENSKAQHRYVTTTGEISHDYDNTTENHSSQMREWQDKLEELQDAYNNTKHKLDEVTEINQEMLLDLQQTEEQASETWKELLTTKLNLDSAQEEIEKAMSLAFDVMRKLDELGFDFTEGDYDRNSSDETFMLTDYISRIHQRVESLLESTGKSHEE